MFEKRLKRLSRKSREEVLEGLTSEDEPVMPGEDTGEEPAEPVEPAEEEPEEPGPASPPFAAAAAPSTFFELGPEEIATWQSGGLELPRGRRDIKKPLLLVAAVLVVLAVMIVPIVVVGTSGDVEVPDVIGKTLSEAIDAARDSGLKPVVKQWKYSGNHSDGVILSQDPVAGASLARDGELSFVVSKGPPPVAEERAVPRAGRTDGSQNSEGGPLAGKVIAIDPGHQGKPYAAASEYTDPGMTLRTFLNTGDTGIDTGNSEQMLTLDIAKKLKGLLEKDGVRVVMSRSGEDVDLGDISRAEIANNEKADLLVSVHTGNSKDRRDKGAKVLYPKRTKWTESFYEKSKTAALLIESELVANAGFADLGVEPKADIVLFNWSKVPVVQAIIGYLTSPEEDRALSEEEYRWKVAWALRKGIIDYLNGE